MAKIELTGKVAIVTGASRGIGEAIARTFADYGARVAITGRKRETLEAVASSIDTAHGKGTCLPFVSHGGKEAECQKLVSDVAMQFGQVDVLVNNAATNLHFGPLLDVDMPAWEKTFEVNLKGYFWMTREVANHLRARNAPGSIVSVASVMGLEAAPLQGMYGMTKAAILSMTKTLAYELASSRIRVNAIAPGLIDTRFSAVIVKTDAAVENVLRKTPLGRIGLPDEIAGGALYLASDAASYLTGHTLVIDGGMTIS